MEPKDGKTPRDERAFESILLARLHGEVIDVNARLAELSQEERDRVERWLGAIDERGLGSGVAIPPSSLGGFELRGELGRGGMGVVYRAWQSGLQREVALKVLPRLAAADPQRLERFFREAKALAALRHPGIVPVHFAGEQDGVPWFAMELVDGVSLGALLAAVAETPPEERSAATFLRPLGPAFTAPNPSYVATILRLVAEAAEALHHAHEHGLLHRDVKPSNLMIDREGRVLVIDFGLARALDGAADELTMTRDLLGSPAYLPPEQLGDPRPAASVRGDVYALGAVLYEALAGRPPHAARELAALLRQVATATPAPLSRWHRGLPRDVVTICHRAIERDPARRYPSAATLAADIRAFLEFRPIAARPPSPLRRVVLAARRNPPAAAAIGLAFAGVLAVIAWIAGTALRTELDVRARVAAVESALVTGDLDAAGEAWRRLDGVAAERPETRRLLRTLADARCAELASRARGLGAELEAARREFGVIAARLEAAEVAARTRYVPPEEARRSIDDRLAAAALDTRLRAAYLGATALAESAAAESRFADPAAMAALHEALASALMEGWRHARQRGEDAWADDCAERVRHFDAAGRHAAELVAVRTVDLLGPDSLELFLFRYLPRHAVCAAERSARWVPVPCDDNGRIEAGPFGGVRPGDLALAVEDPGASDLRPGDLIVAIDGRPVTGSHRVREVMPGGPAALAGVRPWARLVSIGGIESRDWGEIRAAFDAREALEVVVEQDASTVVYRAPFVDDTYAALGAFVVPEQDLFASVEAPVPVQLDVLRDGILVRVGLLPGAAPGAKVVATMAAPILCERKALGRLPRRGLRLPDGEYLAVGRDRAGRLTRCVVDVGADSPAEFTLAPVPETAPPDDAVWIGPGRLERATDPKVASTGVEKDVVALAGFWIARHELQVGEWERFTADPSVRVRIAAAREATGRFVLVPRDADGRTEYATRQTAGKRFAVKQIAANDVAEYLEWRNAELAANGSAWRVRLPARDEWQRAAGSTRRRVHPWGDVWEATLTSGHWTRSQTRRCPVGTHLGDESPYGVFDLAGNVAEWTSDTTGGGELVVCCGGSNQHTTPDAFRIQSDDVTWRHEPQSEVGFRLVWERR
ncbi:MAG: protein kinase [Planctomycetes bacterium]|nr:protein kinase [Planctomycetota bacterium]